MAKKISVCTRYSKMGASSRLRFFMYEKLLEENGVPTGICFMLGGSYLKRLYAGKDVRFHAALALAKRFCQLLFLKKNLLVEYELLPFISEKIEKFFLKRHNYILSFDDAVWEKYRGRPGLEGKFESLASDAKGIIAANDELFRYLSQFNNNVIKIPTVIDLDKYTAYPETEKFPQFTVAWIGTPVTYEECLLPFADMLSDISKDVDFELLVIAKKDLPPIPGVKMRCVDWRTENEVSLLKRSHIGIMPLPENDFMRGKSAYKIIQYLGAGLPWIASPVGENNVLLSNGKTGFSAGTTKEWKEAMLHLATDETLRQEMAKNALRTASDYSLQKYAPIMAEFIKKCFE